MALCPEGEGGSGRQVLPERHASHRRLCRGPDERPEEPGSQGKPNSRSRPLIPTISLMQLRPKLLLALLAVSILPLAVLGVLVYRNTVHHTERLVGHRLQANVVQVADAIDELM